MKTPRLSTAVLTLLALAACAAGAFGQTPEPAPKPEADEPGNVGDGAARPGAVLLRGQATVIGQSQFRLRRGPYEGPASLKGGGESQTTHTYTLFLAARVAPHLDVFVNPEVAAGRGIAAGGGLAGYANGDLIGQQAYGDRAYFARYFVRYVIPTGRGSAAGETVPAAENQIAERRPVPRLVLRLGKMAVTDLMDTNAYANNPRTQFVNNAFGNNLAFDYAQETRGYSAGLFVSWVNPYVTLRAASFALPTIPGGTRYTYGLSDQRGDQIEVELRPAPLFASRQNKAARGGGGDASEEADAPTTVLRLLAFRNVYEGGRYDDALAAASVTSGSGGGVPDLAAVRRKGAIRYGFGLNLEQPLADGGDTGMFARLGWNDGKTESANFAECDRFLSVGVQVSGARWRRAGDRFGLGLAQSDISTSHRDYLAAGGSGLALGDGGLRYGSERIVEAYYSYQLARNTSLAVDYQWVVSPGFNRDRGPANIAALRLHAEF